MAVKQFATSSGTLVWVRATDNFFEAHEHVSIGDYVQVKEGVGNWLQSLDRAVIVDEEEVDAAKAAKAKPAKPAATPAT